MATQLSELELEALANRTGVRAYRAGEMLFYEGEGCAGLYVVVTGRVRGRWRSWPTTAAPSGARPATRSP